MPITVAGPGRTRESPFEPAAGRIVSVVPHPLPDQVGIRAFSTAGQVVHSDACGASLATARAAMVSG